MTSAFKVIEHSIPGQHIREYPNATKHRQEDILYLAIKQYVPLSTPNPVPENSITIIGGCGAGSPKEMYEPIWDDLYYYLLSRKVHIRGIWMADTSNLGLSGVLNEHIQGDDPSWFDHSRDLLHMINHFRSEMLRPLIGIGGSMGCAQLVHLSIIHPRLLSALVLCDPVMTDPGEHDPNPALGTAHKPTFRRDLWDSRAKAEASLGRSLEAYDHRVLKLYMKYGLRTVPTPLYNSTLNQTIPEKAVTLTTTKHQEAWMYARPNFEPQELDRLLLPDWDPALEIPFSYTRPESSISMRNLPNLRPDVLYIFGEKSPLSTPYRQDQKMKLTGSGIGGSGGVAKGRVQKVVIPNAGHNVNLEKVKETAFASAAWIDQWFQRWLADEKFYKEYRSKKSDGRDVLRVSEAWRAMVKLPHKTPRPKNKEKL